MYFATDSLRWTPFANHVSFRMSKSHFSFSPIDMLLRSFTYHTTCIHLSKTAPVSRLIIYKGLHGSWVGRIPNLCTSVLIIILPRTKREKLTASWWWLGVWKTCRRGKIELHKCQYSHFNGTPTNVPGWADFVGLPAAVTFFWTISILLFGHHLQ